MTVTPFDPADPDARKWIPPSDTTRVYPRATMLWVRDKNGGGIRYACVQRDPHSKPRISFHRFGTADEYTK